MSRSPRRSEKSPTNPGAKWLSRRIRAPNLENTTGIGERMRDTKPNKVQAQFMPIYKVSVSSYPGG